MQTDSSRIDPHDTIVLYVDLQDGIVELSRTISLDRLKKGVLGLSRLAKIWGCRPLYRVFLAKMALHRK